MNENMKYKEIQIIKEVFDETRKIIGFAPEEMIEVSDNCHPGGDIFITQDGELIDLEYQMIDFDENELLKYVELAEELYKNNNVPISVYILCPDTIQVTVQECIINSEATFNIKLACYNVNPAYDALYEIKEKANKNIELNDEDLYALLMIAVMGPKKDRRNLIIECFKIMNQSLNIT